jgi:hypothetical protein
MKVQSMVVFVAGNCQLASLAYATPASAAAKVVLRWQIWQMNFYFYPILAVVGA